MDGNDFGCAGTEKLIQPLIDKAETELREKKLVEAEKEAAEEKSRLAEGKLTTCMRIFIYEVCLRVFYVWRAWFSPYMVCVIISIYGVCGYIHMGCAWCGGKL